MQAAVAEYMVEVRVVAVNRSERKNADSDHRKALSTVFRVNRNRTSKKMPAPANTANA